MIPNLAPPVTPGVMIPGQLGPISLTFARFATYAAAFTMSRVGIPSVIHTITPFPLTISNAFAASIIASPANGGGT